MQIDENLTLRTFVQQEFTINREQVENSASNRPLCRKIGEELERIIFLFMEK